MVWILDSGIWILWGDKMGLDARGGLEKEEVTYGVRLAVEPPVGPAVPLSERL